jgi:hypothetical protein
MYQADPFCHWGGICALSMIKLLSVKFSVAAAVSHRGLAGQASG